MGWGKGREVRSAGVQSGWYENLGTKETSRSPPERAGLRARAKNPRGYIKSPYIHRPRVRESWESGEGRSHMEQPNAQGQSRGGARSKQVMTGEAHV